MNLEEIGKRLKQVRKKLGLTLDKMSEISGSSVSGISEMEGGLKKPSSTYLYGLAKEFDIDINWILTGKGAMFAPDIALDLSFGDDNELVKEMIFFLEHLNIARYEILGHFAKFKKENEEFLNDFMLNSGEKGVQG